MMKMTLVDECVASQNWGQSIYVSVPAGTLVIAAFGPSAAVQSVTPDAYRRVVSPAYLGASRHAILLPMCYRRCASF
jgi:hypothetical protein